MRSNGRRLNSESRASFIARKKKQRPQRNGNGAIAAHPQFPSEPIAKDDGRSGDAKATGRHTRYRQRSKDECGEQSAMADAQLQARRVIAPRGKRLH